MFSEESSNYLVLNDWAVNVEKLGRSRDEVIYELLLLSLLYDKILIPDEVFALSNKLTTWFTGEENESLFNQLFDLDSLVILQHPQQYYPTDELKNSSSNHPILTRAEYIQNFSTAREKKFQPTSLQKSFYNLIDTRLSPSNRREVGTSMELDIFPIFSKILIDILSSGHYNNWIKSSFKGITKKMSDEFIRYINDTESALQKLESKHENIHFVVGTNGKPVFNRSFGFQIASLLYPQKQAIDMQRLMQTVFAALFSYREKASGRYDDYLHELILLEEEDILDLKNKERIVTVEAHINTPIFLPDISVTNHDFIRKFNEVRNDLQGINLRRMVREKAAETNFNSQIEAWNGVAELLSSKFNKKRKIHITSSLVSTGSELITGVTTSFFKEGANPDAITTDVLIQLLKAGINLSALVGSDLYELTKNDIHKQKISQTIRKAVEFRCSQIDLPKYILKG